MNKKKEDQIMNLAFGELSADQAELVERDARLDPEAANTLRAYRSMHKDMQLLNDIPAPQLSADRLRHAILQGGLKPKRDYTRWNWILVPLATGVAALTITTFMKRGNVVKPSGAPIFVENAPSNSVAMSSQPSFSFDVPSHPVSFSGDPAIGETDLGAAVSFGQDDPSSSIPAPAPARHIHVRSIGEHRLEASTAPASKPVPTVAPQASAPTGDLTALSMPEDSRSDDNGPAHASKIVVVDSSNDSETGARPATEVGSSADVIVGG